MTILALASSPRMNLNDFWNYGIIYDNASEFNRAVSMPYEPGSVLKVLTMAAALDSGTVVPSTPFLDTGAIQAGGAIIRNWNDEAWGQQDMVGCMQHSLNVCLAWVAIADGRANFYGYMARFGLGHLTGMDLAGEAAGRLKVPGDSDWYPVDLATNAFGQGISVTPMQMLMAVSAVANDGRMVVPHVLNAMVRDGRQYSVPAQYAGSPISPETAQTLSEMLAVSLENRIIQRLVPAIASRERPEQRRSRGRTDMRTARPTHPSSAGARWMIRKFMIYVWLERPSTSIWGSETAAPVFAQGGAENDPGAEHPARQRAQRDGQPMMLTLADTIEALTDFRPRGPAAITEAAIEFAAGCTRARYSSAMPGERTDGHDFVSEAFERAQPLR